MAAVSAGVRLPNLATGLHVLTNRRKYRVYNATVLHGSETPFRLPRSEVFSEPQTFLYPTIQLTISILDSFSVPYDRVSPLSYLLEPFPHRRRQAGIRYFSMRYVSYVLPSY